MPKKIEKEIPIDIAEIMIGSIYSEYFDNNKPNNVTVNVDDDTITVIIHEHKNNKITLFQLETITLSNINVFVQKVHRNMIKLRKELSEPNAV